jgi:DNA-binding MarR family transcriptional regulator
MPPAGFRSGDLTNRPAVRKSRKASARAPRRRGGDVHRDEVARVIDSLRRIVRALHVSNRVAEQRWQVSAAQLLVLQRLAESTTLSVNELAERTFTHQSTVSVVVTRLVRRGLVARSRADDDARRAELSLTAAGRTLLNRAMTAAQTQIIDLLEAMPTARLRRIGRSLRDIIAALGIGAEPVGMFFEDLAADPSGDSRATRGAGRRSPRSPRSR